MHTNEQCVALGIRKMDTLLQQRLYFSVLYCTYMFNKERCVQKTEIQPRAWQDDILRIGEDTSSTQVGNDKLAWMTAENGFKAHEKKTRYVIIAYAQLRVRDGGHPKLKILLVFGPTFIV